MPKKKISTIEILPVEAASSIEHRILFFRGQRVLLDVDLAALESRIESKLNTHDRAIAEMIQATRQLMTPPVPKRKPIGFIHDED